MRDGLHFLLADPAGPVDVVDLRRRDGLPTAQVLLARDHSPQPWSADYDAFLSAAGPGGRLEGADERPPAILRIAEPLSSGRFWEAALLTLHWCEAEGLALAGSAESARTIVWIVGALTGARVAKIEDETIEIDGFDLLEVVTAALPRLIAEAAGGRRVVALLPAGDASEAAAARLREALPASSHRIATCRRFADIIAVLSEPVLPLAVTGREVVVASGRDLVPASGGAGIGVPSTAVALREASPEGAATGTWATRRLGRLAAVGMGTIAIGGALAWAAQRLSHDGTAAYTPVAATIESSATTLPAVPTSPATSASPSRAIAAPAAVAALPAKSSQDTPAARAEPTVSPVAPGGASSTPNSASSVPVREVPVSAEVLVEAPREEMPSSYGAGGATPSPPAQDAVGSPTTTVSTIVPAPPVSAMPPQTVARPPTPPPGGSTAGSEIGHREISPTPRPAPGSRDPVRDPANAGSISVPLPRPQPQNLPQAASPLPPLGAATPAQRRTVTATAAPTMPAEVIRVWELRPPVGRSCLSVYIGESEPVRHAVTPSADGRIEPSKRRVVCGLDVAASEDARVFAVGTRALRAAGSGEAGRLRVFFTEGHGRGDGRFSYDVTIRRPGRADTRLSHEVYD